MQIRTAILLLGPFKQTKKKKKKKTDNQTTTHLRRPIKSFQIQQNLTLITILQTLHLPIKIFTRK